MDTLELTVVLLYSKRSPFHFNFGLVFSNLPYFFPFSIWPSAVSQFTPVHRPSVHINKNAKMLILNFGSFWLAPARTLPSVGSASS
jgi:hypothetical protein